MSVFGTTRLNQLTPLRFDGIVGAVLTGSASDSGWYRLVPDGIDGVRSHGNGLELSNLRSDVAEIDFKGWKIWVSEGNFRAESTVHKHENGVIEGYGSLKIPPESASEIRYILYPELLLPLKVQFLDGTGRLELGFSTKFLVPGVSGFSRQVVTGETTDISVKLFASLQVTEMVEIPVSSIHNIFYQFTEPGAENKLGWTE